MMPCTEPGGILAGQPVQNLPEADGQPALLQEPGLRGERGGGMARVGGRERGERFPGRCGVLIRSGLGDRLPGSGPGAGWERAADLRGGKFSCS